MRKQTQDSPDVTVNAIYKDATGNQTGCEMCIHGTVVFFTIEEALHLIERDGCSNAHIVIDMDRYFIRKNPRAQDIEIRLYDRQVTPGKIKKN